MVTACLLSVFRGSLQLFCLNHAAAVSPGTLAGREGCRDCTALILEEDLSKVFKCRSFPLEFNLALKRVTCGCDTDRPHEGTCVWGTGCERLNKSPV